MICKHQRNVCHSTAENMSNEIRVCTLHKVPSESVFIENGSFCVLFLFDIIALFDDHFIYICIHTMNDVMHDTTRLN